MKFELLHAGPGHPLHLDIQCADGELFSWLWRVAEMIHDKAANRIDPFRVEAHLQVTLDLIQARPARHEIAVLADRLDAGYRILRGRDLREDEGNDVASGKQSLKPSI